MSLLAHGRGNGTPSTPSAEIAPKRLAENTRSGWYRDIGRETGC